MKKLFPLFILLLFISCTENKAPADCSRFKEGKFMIKDKIRRTHFIIERKEDFQTEFDEATDTLSGFKVNWINECEYELLKKYTIKREVTDPDQKYTIPEYKSATLLDVKIKATGNNYYIYEVTKPGRGEVYGDTMWKLK